MTTPASGQSPVATREEQLAALLAELPEAHRAIVESLDRERGEQLHMAERRAVGLQRLQEATGALARVLERDSIERELARHAVRLTGAKGSVVARQDRPDGPTEPSVHWLGTDQPDAPMVAVPPLALAAIQEAARTGRTWRSPASDPAGIIATLIRTGHRAGGVLAVYGMSEPPSSDVADLVATLAATAAASLATAVEVADNLRDKRQSEALAELARALGSSQRIGEVLHLGLRHSSAILGTEGADIALVRGDYLHIVAASGCSAASQGVYTAVGDTAGGRAMLADRALVVNAITPDVGVNSTVRALARVGKFVSVPLRMPGGPIGVLSVVNRSVDFDESDVRVLERLAAQLAVAVVKVRLFEEADDATRELKSAFDAIAGGMAVVDGDGFILRHNARLAAVAGANESASLVGHSLYELITGEPTTPRDDEPIGAAIVRRAVGRGLMRPRAGDRVFEVIASPHPQGGAVVTVDDVTSFLSLAERYRLVVDSTTDAIVITDAAGVATFANAAATVLFGRDVAGTGAQLCAFVAPSFTAAMDEGTRRALAGEASRLEAEVLRPDGDRRVVSASLAPVRSGSRVTGCVASLRDATSESRARAAMAEADTRYRNLFETATDAIFTVDASGVITSANTACARATGYSRDALAGRRMSTLIEPTDAAMLSTWFEAGMAGRPAQFECHVARTDGTIRLMSVSFSPIRTHDAVAGLLGIARDVTEERAQTAALERAEARYARLVEAADDAICTLDEEGRITSANRSFCRVVRRMRNQVLGRHFADVVPEEQRGVLWEMFAATLAGARRRGEVQYLSHLGKPAVVSVSTAPLVEHDRVIGALAIIRDMTEERALFERAARRDKLAALGELVGGVAHEVNSPLTGILAHAQLLQADVPADSDERRFADTIVNEARRAARIVGKLLTFARQNPTERIPTDINQVILDTVELRRYPLRMQGVDLVITLAENLPHVWADPFQLQQVLINLLSNAEQSVVSHDRPERRIELRSEQSESELLVSVADTGSGIAPEHLPHIFNPFYTTKPRGVGTGLGLSISFGIVREHGGSIQATSRPGQGATFTVHLPIRDARNPARAG